MILCQLDIGQNINLDVSCLASNIAFVKLQGLGLRQGVDFTFTLDNNDNNDNNHNDNDNNHNDNDNNPHLNFFKGTLLT